jgi:hypothetical protein
MKEALRTANREWSQPAFKERVREGITIDKIRDHFEGVAKKIISLSHPHPNVTFQDTSVEDQAKLNSFMERFDEMEPVLDYWFHLKTIGDNATKVRKATNAWVVYYQLHKWYTEATGQMVQEQVKAVTNPSPIKDDRDIYLSIEKWESDITQLAQYGDDYNFTESAELKLSALEMMFKDKLSLWESVERGIESTKPASAKLVYMLENLKAIGFRRKGQGQANHAKTHANPLDVNYLQDNEASYGHEAGGHGEYDEYGHGDYGKGYYEEAGVYQLGKGKSKGKGKGPKGGCFTCGGDHYASECPKGKGKGKGKKAEGGYYESSKGYGKKGSYWGGYQPYQQWKGGKGKSKGKGKGQLSEVYYDDEDEESYDHSTCLGYPSTDVHEVSVKPARSDKDMRPKKEKAKKEDLESDKEKLKKEIDEDFEQAILEHTSAIKNAMNDDNGNVYQLVKKKKGPSYNPHARLSAQSYGKQDSGAMASYGSKLGCCINSIEREIAETKSMKMSDGSGKNWERIRVKLDSGAIDWVFTPEAGEAFETKPSMFSRYGINYTAANGTEIKNFGQKTLTGYSDEWTPLSVNVQIADVKSNLAAGMKIIEADNRIILDASGSYIENKKTGDRIQIRHENGCFVFDMWVTAKNTTGQGARRATGQAARTTAIKNQYQPLEDSNMDVGAVDDRREAVFTRQEC